MVIQSLSHQFQRQRVRHAAGFLQLGALVLEPDLDLRLVKSELGGEPLTPLLGQVAAGVELSPQDAQLITQSADQFILFVYFRAAECLSLAVLFKLFTTLIVSYMVCSVLLEQINAMIFVGLCIQWP